MSDATLQHLAPETVDWLHREMIRGVALCCIGVGVGWYAILGLVFEVVNLREWSSALILIATGLVVWRLQTHLRLAALLQIGGIAIAIGVAAWAWQDETLFALLTLPIGLSGLLLHRYVAVVLALVAGLWLLPMGSLLIANLLITVGLVWLAMIPQNRLVHWASQSYLVAKGQTAEAREHRGELVSMVKQVNAANQQLNLMAIELERARSAANEARRLKAEFAANISHELRTPLNLIIGFSEMMARSPRGYSQPLPDDYRDDIQTIYRNAQHLSSLVDDVLDLSQIEAGRMGLVQVPLSLATVIQEAIDTVAALYTSKGLTLRADLPSSLPIVEADRTRIRQVMLNLLSNAVRFTEQGGVTITADNDEEWVTVSVTDTGTGIPMDKLPQLFQEFSQLDGMIHYHASSGLGLAISKQFIELHGGHIHVQSVEGEGTTISFSLPQQRSLPLGKTTPSWETWVRLRRGGERTVAILAPNATTAHLFERYLDTYRVITVASKEDAWQLASRQAIQALVLVASAGEQSWPLLRELRDSLPNLPLLLCTLRGGTPELTSTTAALGATAYLAKPVSQDDFLQVLATVDATTHEANLVERTPGEHTGDSQRGERTLLIVDDEADVVRMLTRMVETAASHYQIINAYDGHTALRLIKEKRPDVIVLDLLMPEVDGYTILDYLRESEAHRDIPVIVISAKGRVDETVRAGLVGISRRDGLSLAETMRCFKATLDALQLPDSSAAP